MKTIYLDHAATTPVDPGVIEVMRPYWSEKFHNPSAVYLAGRDARQALDAARQSVAHWLGCRSDEIIFTTGATESNNLAVFGVLNNFSDGEIIVSSIEHDAVLKPALSLKGRSKIVGVDKKGQLDFQELAGAITAETVLVSVIYANNEIGSVQKLSEIARLIEAERDRRRQAAENRPIYFHTDATQAANYLDLHINRLGVDLMTLNASKIYGPKQSGVLFKRGGVELAPMILGGGQERGLRSGTENVAGAVGLAAALDLVQTLRHDESRRLEDLQKKAEAALRAGIKNLTILGGRKKLPNNICLLIPGLDGERAVMELDEAGIQCSTGSACAALSDESSHVIKALGYTDDQARATLRLTMGRSTSEAQIMAAVKIIIDRYA